MKTFDHYIYEKVRKGDVVVEIEIELIQHNSKGEILFWFLWSEYCQDWIPQNLDFMQNVWPARFEEMIDTCRELAANAQAEKEGA